MLDDLKKTQYDRCVFNCDNDVVERITVDVSAENVGGHMGGDYFMMNSLYKALNGEEAEGITYLDVSIESHLMCFAAEESRLNNGKPQEIKR